LNALALGEEDAAHLGVDVRRVKRGLIVLSASLVGATVALCGMIGFIPLVAPHIVRTAVGADHRFLMPASALVGAALLLVADMAARSVVAPAELPLGILTGLLGAPVFLSLIIKRNRVHL
jgi:iron complex transport system permease protein